jgi:hypothetical protein
VSGRSWADHGVVLLRAKSRFDARVPNGTPFRLRGA